LNFFSATQVLLPHKLCYVSWTKLFTSQLPHTKSVCNNQRVQIWRNRISASCALLVSSFSLRCSSERATSRFLPSAITTTASEFYWVAQCVSVRWIPPASFQIYQFVSRRVLLLLLLLLLMLFHHCDSRRNDFIRSISEASRRATVAKIQ